MTKVNIVFTKKLSSQSQLNFIVNYLAQFRWLLPLNHKLQICLDLNQVKHQNIIYCYLGDYHLIHFQYHHDADLILGLSLIKNIGDLLMKSGQFSLITYYQNEATIKTTVQLDGDILHQIKNRPLSNADDFDKIAKVLQIHHFICYQILHSFHAGLERRLLILISSCQMIGWLVSFSISLKMNSSFQTCMLELPPTFCVILQFVVELVSITVFWWMIGYIVQRWFIPYLSRFLWQQMMNPNSLLSQWLLRSPS